MRVPFAGSQKVLLRGFARGVPAPEEALLFCPNCGTKNPETATTCTKCGFNIKGAAAPKFKGTMLMMNQPGGAKSTPAPPPPAPAPPAAAAPTPGPAAPADPPKQAFKGTLFSIVPPGR